jgi:hypothetical protein
LENAEVACLQDAPARAERARQRAEHASVADQKYVARFAQEVRRRYPSCPDGREHSIAAHACRKYSARIGRSATAKAFDTEAIDLAVRAHIRHAETDYDNLLARGTGRAAARHSVAEAVAVVLDRWAR